MLYEQKEVCNSTFILRSINVWFWFPDYLALEAARVGAFVAGLVLIFFRCQLAKVSGLALSGVSFDQSNLSDEVVQLFAQETALEVCPCEQRMYGTEWVTYFAASPQEPVAVGDLGFAAREALVGGSCHLACFISSSALVRPMSFVFRDIPMVILTESVTGFVFGCGSWFPFVVIVVVVSRVSFVVPSEIEHFGQNVPT